MAPPLQRMKQPCFLRGVDFDPFPVPPLRRGARGDLDLIVKQQSVTTFDVKLTRRRAKAFVPTPHKPGIRCKFSIQKKVDRIPTANPTQFTCSTFAQIAKLSDNIRERIAKTD